MLTPDVKTEIKTTVLEYNILEVQRTLAEADHIVLPQHTALFTLYRGELVTYAQALDMRAHE